MKPNIEFFEDEHIYLVDGEEMPSVTSILAPLNDVEYKKINPAILEYAAQRGTAVHEYLEMYDYGVEEEEIEYEIRPYIQAYKDFLDEYKPKYYGIEKIVYSPFFNFIGTLDRYGIINGRKAIIDLKTINSPTKINKMSVCIQTLAYSIALKQELGIQEDIDRYALYLNKEGEYNLMDCELYEKKYGLDSFQYLKQLLELQNLKRMLVNRKPIKKGEK